MSANVASMYGMGGSRPKKWWEGELGPAINELDIANKTMKTNEPINRKQGDKPQADLERGNSGSFEKAMKILKRFNFAAKTN